MMASAFAAAAEPRGLLLAVSLARTATVSPGAVKAALAAAAACTVRARVFLPAECAAESSHAAGKPYEVKLKGVRSVFAPRNLLVSVTRCTILAFAPLVERYLAAMEEAAEMEERGVEPPPVAFPDVWPAVQRAQKSVARDLAVQLCRRGLERLVVATQPARTAAKLLKDVPRSVRRKSARHSFAQAPCWTRASVVGRTALRAYVVVVGGELIVQQAIVTAAAVQPQGRVRRPLRLLLRQTTQNVARAAACCAGASAGAAAVALLLPADRPTLAHWSTVVGLLAGDVAGAMLVSTLTDDWVAAAKR